jgi:hypothetical protein
VKSPYSMKPPNVVAVDLRGIGKALTARTAAVCWPAFTDWW